MLFYCRALLGGAAQFIGMRAYNLYKIRNDFFVSVSIYVRYIWLRTEVAARSTHTHRQARVHGHYTHTNSTKSNRSAQLLSGTRTHAHTHTANTQRCLVVNASSQRGRMNPEKHNKTRRSTQLNVAAAAERRTPTPTATQLRERTCVGHSLLAWCDRTKTLSLSLSLSLFICFVFFFACSQNKHSINVCLSLSCGLQLPDRLRVGSYRLSKFAID